ncbi:transcriptional effector [Grosmannia clavigera kw1407]|uniref:CCR4-Not complex 3'-5'-exoribonuclease subunit Ccr4 n=1 Tax=Grosmannia clavigera (strain kw1407 / UAMH 11150) TaxID=655863 RepID=F0XP06_GROCL|nr:transcriptional effector [Grosmannia clavigera kw1407]EFX00204.1 transcriptional effector [Grosmannia clavigera kw1407]
MYNQNHQQGHGSRLNGNPTGRGMPMLYSFQQPGNHQHQAIPQHHQVLQAADQVTHNASSALAHHSAYSAGVMSNVGPFSNGLQNGHSAAMRAAQQTPMNEHWAEQLRMHKEAETANIAMVEQNQANYYARLKASENKGIGGPSPILNNSSLNVDGDAEDVRRTWTIEKKSNRRQDWHNLDLSGQGLRALSPQLFHYDFLQELYIASNKLTVLPAAIGSLRQLRLLEASNNQISELPVELGMCTFLKQLLLFNNNIRTLPYELGSLHMLEMLGIEGNPLDPELKKEIIEKGTKSLIVYLREQPPIPPPPNDRKLVVVQEDVSPALEHIKVFSWNILGERYATPQVFSYTPSGALAWDYRKEKIMDEIRYRNADFVCLQEITTDALRETFGPELAQADYRSIHYPRSKARTMTEKDAATVDGCAIFYKGSKFVLLDKQLIDFQAIAINRPDMKTQHDIFNRVMPKDNIAIVGFFESRRTGARMIVVSAHLCWEGTLADVKIVQTALIMEFVTKQAEKYARWPALKDKKAIEIPGTAGADPVQVECAPSQEYRSNTDLPLFLCGDYNSTADSGVIELLREGRLPRDHHELGKYQYGNFTRDGIEHPFSLKSAYQHLASTPDELPFTNYTPGFANVIDYIWYTTNTLEVVEVLGRPDAEYLKRVPGFPNYHFPADHIQIMADIVIKPRKDKKGSITA